MSIDERDRLALHRRLEQVLGPEHAVNLVASLPPAGDRVATGRDIERLWEAVHALGDRIDRLEGRMDRLEGRMDGLYVEIRAQTRTYLIANTGLIATVAALAFGAARLV
ncbi:MAG: hypothetical protein WD010_10050 [Nitriliruptor sp.]|uniref:hypothetical protein n=1 Tax=Nitriliruptor sp. TaxID=2448056 RepID=UPI0034A05965